MKISPPAFPTYLADNMAHGMSLRDYFAAAAMPSAYKFWMEDYYKYDYVGFDGKERDDFINDLATTSYEIADAMMKARQE